MIGAFLKGFEQLGDKSTGRVLWLSIAAALVVFGLLWGGVGWVLTRTAITDIGWVETIIDVLGGVATLVITWFLFPGVVSAVIGLLLDGIAGRVELRHYPALPPARDQPVGEMVITTLRFLGLVVAFNLLTLPFLLFPPIFPFVFYAVNGYLLSREYFEMVAMRRLGSAEATRLRRSHRGTLFVAGLALAFLLTVPVVNLLAPIVGTAAMVHLFHAWADGARPVTS